MLYLKGEAEHQLQDQAGKQSRAKKKLAKAKTNFHSDPRSSSEHTAVERDIALAAYRESNRSSLSNLKNLALEKPELRIAEKLESVGIRLPTSVSSSASGNRASSRPLSPRPGSARSAHSGVSSKGEHHGGTLSVTTIELGTTS